VSAGATRLATAAGGAAAGGATSAADPTRAASSGALAPEPLWYKDAIVYELHVRAFADSNGDGIGDFKGLATRLDYLQSLGITALWLLPFYPSPLRDDGYDIADYTTVNPSYGDLKAFRTVLREAHRRGLRVITELVMNHTSDQHPWFQRARAASAGSRWRRWYVWSDTPERYAEARIIFEDYESSNWAWDPVAGAYYWHRFFSHQPDLNFDNAEVRRAMLKVVDRWFAMGVDGMRLDAVPYLIEREGTNCENLEETHGFLKELRAHVDERYPGRMLLAEANQWPEDAVEYFGEGDECHTSFHFPLMPRLFMSLRMEDRHPLIDILEQTPAIPETCQWMIFLRNHDELTLEMVTDEERDYMYRSYAADPEMRVNLGIRRRLAPLLQNDRRRIELMYALLFSLPGTPVIYYGEELGMGDNVYLGDRDAVRTPMQWSPDRNAGFSTANPQRLYLPAIIDPEYHYESTNVEAQLQNPSSLLWWMRRIIALRRQHRVFGNGDIEFLFPENAKVLAFIRSFQGERVLVVANLSRHAVSVDLDLHEHRGTVPVELFGREEFRPVGDGLYPITLGPYGFHWFSLDTASTGPLGAAGEQDALPTFAVDGDWHDLIERGHRLDRVLPAYLERTRWYGGKGRRVRGCHVAETIPLRSRRAEPIAYLLFVELEYTSGDPATYALPVTVTEGARADEVLAMHGSAAIGWIEGPQGRRLLLFDAVVDAEAMTLLLDLVANRRALAGRHGRLAGRAGAGLASRVRATDDLTPRWSSTEQSNTSIVFGGQLILKLYRRVTAGINPDLELGRHLTATGFDHIAALFGSMEYARSQRDSRRNGEPLTVAVLNEYVTNEGDGWRHALHALDLFLEEVTTSSPLDPTAPVPSWRELPQGLPDALGPDAVGPILDDLRLLGQRTAEMHLHLARPAGDFAPEPFNKLYQRSLYQSIRAEVKPTLQLLRRASEALAPPAQVAARELLDHQGDLEARIAVVRAHPIDGLRIRIHGDLHLGQVLRVGHDFVVIDFEGEPARPTSARRIKRSPLRDVAGMLRSFQYVARAATAARADQGLNEPSAPLEAAVERWRRWAEVAYLAGYLETPGIDRLLPTEPTGIVGLLDTLLLEKALYELSYELASRPDWVLTPLEGVLEIIDHRREESG
jgi:maltose alpha-D-glucosyltransferase / alpha-amylase